MNNRIGVELVVDYDTCKARIPLERRITYLRGDSGEGKTTVYELLAGYSPEKTYLKWTSGYSIAFLIGSNTDFSIRNNKKTIFLSDDSILIEYKDFAEAVTQSLAKNNNYILIINRVDILSSAYSEMPNISVGYSISSVLRAVKRKDNITVDIIKDIEFPIDGVSTGSKSIKNTKYILCEDAFGSREFFDCHKTNNTVVLSSYGKDLYINKLRNVLEGLNANDILLCVDMAVFGAYFNDLMLIISLYSDIDFYIDIEFESFEYMLLKSNLYSKPIDFSKANDYNSWEQYFEVLARGIRDNRFFLRSGLVHGNHVNKCVRFSCKRCPNYNDGRCPKCREDDRLRTILEGTQFDYVIDILEG